MVSIERRSTAVSQWGTRLQRLTLTLGGGLEGPPRPVMAPYPFPSASSVGVGRHRGSTWVTVGNLVAALSPAPSHAVSRCSGPTRRSSWRVNPPVSPFGPALVPVLPRADRAVRTVSPAACSHVRCAVVCTPLVITRAQPLALLRRSRGREIIWGVMCGRCRMHPPHVCRREI